MKKNNPMVVKVRNYRFCPFLYTIADDTECCSVAGEKRHVRCSTLSPPCPLLSRVSIIVKHVEE